MSDQILVLVCTVLVPGAAIVVALWAARAACDYGTPEPPHPACDPDARRWARADPVPAAPDNHAGARDDWRAICEHAWNPPQHQPPTNRRQGDQ